MAAIINGVLFIMLPFCCDFSFAFKSRVHSRVRPPVRWNSAEYSARSIQSPLGVMKVSI